MSRRAAVAKGQAAGGLASGVSNAASCAEPYDIDADAKREDIEAPVAQSQKRSAGHDIVTNPTMSRWW
jgi:hypothetical protein